MVDALEMLEHIGVQIPELIRLVTAFAYVLGIWLVIQGICSFKKLPPIGQSDPPTTLWACCIKIVVGVGLLYLPSVVDVVTNSFWTDTVPYAYMDGESVYYRIMNVIKLLLQLIGVIAVVRGLTLLVHNYNKQDPNERSKAIVHIIGGAMCINIELVIMTVFTTLGIAL